MYKSFFSNLISNSLKIVFDSTLLIVTQYCIQVALKLDTVTDVVNHDTFGISIWRIVQNLFENLIDFLYCWIVKLLQLARTKMFIKVSNSVCVLF